MKKLYLIPMLFLIYWGCKSNSEKKSFHENWKVESQLTKRINNVNFNFPENFIDLDLNYLADLDMQSPLLKDYTISVGLGLPIPKNLSEANIGFQYGFRGTKDDNLIHEKYFNIIFSITFNDKWFTKRKID